MMRSRPFPPTKTALIRSLGDGVEASSWREFFDRYAPAIYNVAIRSGVQPSDAEDIVQRVMMSIAKSISDFRCDKDRGKFRTWVKRITRNAIIDQYRSKRKSISLDDIPQKGTPELECPSELERLWAEEWQLQDLEYCLNKVATRISSKRVLAFQKYVLEGFSAAETAAMLNLTIGNVYSVRFQVLKLIREEMQRLDDAESK
ncbi:MAG: RNA polymerase sigma factor [Phycisphaerales bacterium]|nr:RNA polymerase sigma factor [Phycisphaerales bacterium]